MPRTRIKEEGPNPIDIYVGGRLKARRLMLGLSQEELGNAIGLTFQQVQKYERGTNRISVSRLVDICKALRVPFGYFLDNCGPKAKKAALRGVADNKQALIEGDPMTRKDVLELVRYYELIRTPALKKQLVEMAKAMAASTKKG